MDAKTMLFIALGAFTLYYLVSWVMIERGRNKESVAPAPANVGIGFVTNFFDTLGIGSFATTTSMWKFFRLIDDRLIPGTLNTGHTLPTIVQAFIFILVVQVDMTTLITLIVGAVLGAWLGAGVISKWNRRKVQIGMGAALLVFATLLLITQLQNIFGMKIMPAGGEAAGLSGPLLVVGFIGNFVLGALMSLGIGLYAPCLVMISLLGMSPAMAFPIMMGSCAFLMPVGSVKFIREKSYDMRAAIGLAIGGIPAALIAGLIVKSLPLDVIRWLVLVVVIYAAVVMLRSAAREKAALEKPAGAV
jgi:uncharacterized membrane protein YfcA